MAQLPAYRSQAPGDARSGQRPRGKKKRDMSWVVVSAAVVYYKLARTTEILYCTVQHSSTTRTWLQYSTKVSVRFEDVRGGAVPLLVSVLVLVCSNVMCVD
jgi:hypothetical protein